MGVFLKFLFSFFLLHAAISEMYIGDNADETTKLFIQDESKNIKELIKEEMKKLFANVSESFEQRLTSLEMNVNRSFRDFYVPAGGHLLRSESKITGDFGTLNETLRLNYQQLLISISNLRKSFLPAPTLTEVEEVNAEQGTIYFNGGINPHLRRKVWVLQSEFNGDSYRGMSFVMGKMRLGDNARLSLWSSNGGIQHEWKGSQRNWREKITNLGNLNLVTLTISPEAAEMPSFKLKFNTTDTPIHNAYDFSSELVVTEGRQDVSFPPNNAKDYPRFSHFVALVAPPSGRSFGLTVKHLEFQGTSPNCNDNLFDVWFLEETATGDPYKQLPSSVVRGCENVCVILDPLLNTTVAIIRFRNGGGNILSGFRVAVN